MQEDKRALMLEALGSDRYRQRLDKVHRFEEISGGGVLKMVQRLFTAPSIYLPYVFYAKTGLAHRYSTSATLFWDKTIRISLKDYDALILSMYGGLYGAELNLTKFLIKNLESNDVFYDIGANRGYYTFVASELCKETHAFEPLSELVDVIRESVQGDASVTVNSVALSDIDGAIDFYVMDSTMVNTINASVAKLLSSQDYTLSKRVTVPSMTIDAYIKTHTKPTFLKIDAEGAEEQIIKGGKHFFSSNAPVIAMEIWGKENKWELSMSAAERLRAMGYQSYRLDSEGTPQKVDGDLSVGVSPAGGEDFIFKKGDSSL
ncbi:MAG: FkbM family methyltransferase [Candidatus Parcubacteria bacterium]|nr:FkbM family methyltransferase [Candidatus Parcubacteria bacterium]